MTIIIGILVPAILFLITLPLQSFLFLARQSLKLKEIREKKRYKGSLKSSLGFSSGSSSLKSRLGISDKKEPKNKAIAKFNIMRLKAEQQLIRSLSMLISFLRSLASSLICAVLSAVFILLPTFVVLIIAASGIVVVLSSNPTYNPVYNNVTSETSKDKNDNFTGDVSTVRYLQSNYPDIITGSTDIASSGCGWCSLTHMMVSLNPEQCGKMTPPDWLKLMPANVKSCWASGGMGWDAPKLWVNAINDMKTYGQYELVYEFTSSGDNTETVFETAKKYMHEKNTVMVLSSSTGLFTGGGHIILLTSVGSDDSYFTITDSSNKAYNYLLNAGESVTSETMNSFHFPMNVTSLHGYPYNLKCCWVVKRLS